ncbi:MAG: NADH-quinone oxidoreductase subunit N, partial [Planctomycetaceae bacterium]
LLRMSDAEARTLVMAAMMVLVGIAFKLSAVPFHFWCPDAFEGAPAEVAGFLSVASKGAAFALLIRFALALVGDNAATLAEVHLYLGIGIGVIAAVSATFGNLAAYAQTNIKRLLAYSTIAHAGYMLMAVSALLILLGGGAEAGLSSEEIHYSAARCLEGLLYYLAVYLFMNLGAFAIVALIRNEIYSEELDDYAGLGRQNWLLCVCMGVCLISLIGIPPLGGFFAKWIVFYSLFQAGYVHNFAWALLVIGGLNTVISLFYYVRVLRLMFLEPRPAHARRVDIAFWPIGGYVLLVTLPVIGLGIFVDPLSNTAQNVAVDTLATTGGSPQAEGSEEPDVPKLASERDQ